ncbi:hypothetical protein QFC22_004024 [Naganishia vaughanmartiniae]|uniref:Uncharacterized protein n=1 Tax=Naganishia vaughanmartiniae TaxID=1424756 RepID=A0ACC2X2Y5_9TREE|nr:hypothetical protein QFC22_004024 [Naganishia vaughanmartiniae]
MFRRGDQDDSSDSDSETAPSKLQDSTNTNPIDKISKDEAASDDDEDDDDEEGGLFGNILDIPADEDKEAGEPSEASRVVTPREFPLPKHLPSAFALPKKLLSDLIVSRKAISASRPAPTRAVDSDGVSSFQPEQRFVVTTLEYKEISRGSRLKRYRLDIVFTPEGKSISKGNKHVSAVARKTIGGLSSAGVVGTPDGPSGAATPASTVSMANGAEQFPSIETALKDIKLDSTGAEDPGSKAQPAVSLSPTEPLEPVFLDDSTYMIQMEDVGCPTSSEAENYLALIALHEFTTGTHHSLMTTTKSRALGLSSMTSPACIALRMEYPPINARHLPLPYRDLWDELERTRKLQEDEDSRSLWKGLDEVLEAQVRDSESIDAGNEKAGPGSATKGVLPELSSSSSKGRQSRPSRDAPPQFDQRIQAGWTARSHSPAYQKMLAQRETLPIADYREEIVKALEDHQVLVLSGETGCGKSTQLPSFILESHLAKGLPCKILVTEPRRIGAISLADRVSKELGDTGVGGSDGQGSLVGYSIRLENKIGRNTRLAFVTNGIALRMLENSAGSEGQAGSFDEVTHIVVDEVHERSIDSDFLMIVLKSLMQERKDLKIILMSATMNSEKICAYFDNCPFFKVPGRTFPVQVNFLEDAVELTHYFIAESSPYAIRHGRNRKQIEWSEEMANNDDDEEGDLDQPSDPMKLSSAAYSQETVRTVNLLDPKQIPYGLIMRLLEHLCLETNSPYSQAILVFLPGINEIRKLHDLLVDHNQLGNARDYKIYPLHSTISSENQGAVFEIPPKGVRKIVLSTNIAETGVTIPDITCVIDSGKHREMRYDEKRSISRLTETYIARSNAAQRRGRAGRVQEGLAFHLFTRARHDTQLADHPEPEILRLSLQDLALRIKILKVKVGTSIADGLSKALDPPSPINVARAVSSLVEVKALTAAEEITPMGLLLSRLPVDVHLGKFLLLAALFKCLDPALTIAATLNSKSPFVAPFGREQEADTIKQSFKKGQSYPRQDRFYTLQQIEELRQQLYSYLVDTNFVRITPAEKEAIARARYRKGFRTSFVTIPNELNENAEDENMLNAALVAGLYPKILIVEGGNGLKTLGNNQSISIHPSSINFRGRIADFGVNHMVYYTIMQSKKLYAWETSPVDDIALFLLCGEILDIKTWASSVVLDRKIKFNMPPVTILALQRLRTEFANCLSQRMASIPLDPEQEKWFELGLKCIMKTVEEEQEDAYKLRISRTKR